MKNLRRKRLVDLLNGPRFNGDRSAFLASANLSKGRLTQLLNPKEQFGDTAARNLCEALELPEGWFDSAPHTEAQTAAQYGIDPSAAKVASKFGVTSPDSDGNQAQAHVDKAPVDINTIATIIERFVTLVAESDDLTRDQIKTLLARLCDQPARSGEVVEHLMKHFGTGNDSGTDQEAAKSYSSGRG